VVLCCLVAILAGIATMVALVATWSKDARSAPITAPATSPTAETTTSTAPSPSATATKRPSTGLSKTARSRLTSTLAGYLDDGSGRLAISVRDLSTGVTFGYETKLTFATASIVKADVLTALLLQAQRAGRTLTVSEKSLASRMIEYSDNGLTSANHKLGLRRTVAGSGGYWGLTLTNTADQVRLLSALTSKTSPLKARNRTYALGLMQSVSSSQDWGVSAGVDDDDSVALKNGWLSRATDGNTWVVNSIGRVHGSRHNYLIAILSDHNTTMSAGVTKVEHVSKLIATALAKV
jgi:beta-lactamase class A